MINDWEFPEFELLERLKRINEENNLKLRSPTFKNAQIEFYNLNSLNRKYIHFYIFNSRDVRMTLVKSPLGQMSFIHLEHLNPTDDQIIESIRWFLE